MPSAEEVTSDSLDLNNTIRYEFEAVKNDLTAERRAELEARISELERQWIVSTGTWSITQLSLEGGTVRVKVVNRLNQYDESPLINLSIYDENNALIYTEEKNMEAGITDYAFNVADIANKRTAVVRAASKSDNAILAEGAVTLTTSDECFIATAAFGSKLQPAVALLRQFRDKCLLTNWLGKKFVEFYYRNSPPIANFIAANGVLRAIVRVLLIPLIIIAYGALNPVKAILALIILIGMILGFRNRNRKVLIGK
jgi:hypothetical protein